MSYNRSYNYSSPLGGYSGSHSSSNYSSPSGRYSSTSSYDSSSRRYDSGLGSGGYGSGLSGGGYGSGLGSGGYGSSKYGSGSLSSLSGSSYSPRYSGSSYSPSSSSYSSGRYDSTSRGSGYTPRSDYSSSRYSRPVSSYDDYGSSTRNRSSDTSSSSRHRSAIDDDDIPVKANRKIKFDDEVETTPTRSKRSTDSSSLTTKTSGDSSASEARRKRREEKEATDDKGGSPIPTRSADVDVSNVTRKTENLTIDNPAPTRPYSPSFQEYGKQAAESARYQEQTGDTPQYRPYTNPNIQSNSFKTLQNVIETGRDPGSYFQKAPWQSTTVNQVENQPRKYTPSKTWAAVHNEGRENAPPGPASHQPRQTAPYQPAPAHRPQAPPSAPNPYTPPNFYNKPAPKSGSPSRGTTSLPHGDGVATKGTSAMNQQSANPDKIPVCGKCDKEIRGPFVLALNKSWCPSCFTCDQCGSELVNMGFVELNGKIYCENDYENFFAPKCAKCRLPIIGDTVNALDKTWHPACFVCAECGCAISSGAFHVEDGLPYCMKDWQRLFQTKCTGCTYPVEPGDKWIEALDANWHSECFVCGVCQLKLEGQPFYPKDGKPFCKAHAAA